MPGRVVVLQTLPGTPSAKPGLMPGDEIMAINNYVAQNDLFPSGRPNPPGLPHWRLLHIGR